MVYFIKSYTGFSKACGFKGVQRVTLLSLCFIDQEVALFFNADINRQYSNFHLVGQVIETTRALSFTAVAG